MATGKEVSQLVKSSLRSVLLSSQKGLPQTSIPKDYKKLTHSELDVKKYGYRDLYEFLLALPDVARLQYSEKDGENRVFGVAEKGVYISDHAKKAEGIPNGLKPLPPSEWPRNKAKKAKERSSVAGEKSPLKVNPAESDDKRKILPNHKGLYTLHIKNIPPNCQEHEISHIFKQFGSLREVKIENSLRAAFVRFSNYADAVRGLSEMDGYSLRGASLTISPGTERSSQQNAKFSKDKKEDSKDNGAKKNKTPAMVNGFVDKKTVVKDTKPGSRMDSALSSPKENKTFAQEDSWETGGALSPKTPTADNMKFFNLDDVASRVAKDSDGTCPIHVSNFPVGTTLETLRQLFRPCGDIAHIKLLEKFGFIYFKKREGAETALQKMKGTRLGEKILTVTPRTPKPKKQDTSPVAASTLKRVSSQSSVSSNDSATPQSPKSHNNSGAASSSALNSNGHAHSDQCNDTRDRGLSKSSTVQQNASCSNRMDTTKDGGILEENKTTNSSLKQLTEGGNKSHTSTSMGQGVPVHLLLTYEEMCELSMRCNKPLRTSDNIGAQEFDILVTDIIDSCHFWANIDDQRGSYKELEQIQSDLQIVEHHNRCMPVKYQLGASLFSEDKRWYRCWCLEVSNVTRKEAKVFFIDYGNCEWISWDSFTDIHKRFWNLAPQAVPFKLAGLENASNLSPEILKEGSQYLKALIINKVCKARISQSTDPNKPHVMEVELTVTSENKSTIQVNKQMALTRYVQQTRKGPHVMPGPGQTQSAQELKQPMGPWQQTTTVQPQQPVNQMSPQPSMNSRPLQAPQAQSQAACAQALTQVQEPQAQTQSPLAQAVQVQAQAQTPTAQTQSPQAQAAQVQAQAQTPKAAAQHVRWPVEQNPQPSKEAHHLKQFLESRQANSQKNPAQSPQTIQVNKQSLLNHNTEPVDMSLPSYVYQLFEKKEVMDVFLSYASSPDELFLFSADKSTQESLQHIGRTLLTETNPKAKIYPRVGDIVTKVQDHPNGDKKVHRVRIQSIPKTNAIGVDKVVVQNVDYGWRDTVPLSCLCELPASLRQLPTYSQSAKLAGIQVNSGMRYPEKATSLLIDVKARRKPLKASVVKRQEDGVLLVELFDHEGQSLNVQLLRKGWVQLDESFRHLLTYSVPPGSDSSGFSQNQTSSSLPGTAAQNPRWQPHEKRLDHRPVDVQSHHSDWEESMLSVDTDWMEATPASGASGSHDLYMPPTPEMHSPASTGSGNTVTFNGIHPTSASGSTRSSSGSGSPMLLNYHSPVAAPSPPVPMGSVLPSVPPPSTRGSVSSHPHDRHHSPSALSSSSSSSVAASRVPSDVPSPSYGVYIHARPSSSGSESGNVNSHTSLLGLSGTAEKLNVTETDNRTAINGEEKTIQDTSVAQNSLEKGQAEQEDEQNWWQEKNELIQKDEELKRMLDMPRSEMMKMIRLRQEKEKLERKIRVKGLENQILKLQKELKQLEVEKDELEGGMS